MNDVSRQLIASAELSQNCRSVGCGLRLVKSLHLCSQADEEAY